MIRYIIYFNLLCGIVLLLIYIKSPAVYYDYYYIAGGCLAIWYNWETLKQLKGQKSSFITMNFIIGLMTILFGVLLILSSLGKIKYEIENSHDKAGLLTMGIRMFFGLTIIFLTGLTLRFYR